MDRAEGSKEGGNKVKKFVRRFKEKDKRVIKIDVRLNKYISNCGICTRREADELISKGEIKVNDRVITELGYKIRKNDVVKYRDKLIRSQNYVYLLLNKPKDFVTTLKDPHAKHTVFDIVKHACKERIYPVDRLDINTTGVLLFTNDDALAEKLTSPALNKKRIYHVGLNKPLSLEDMDMLTKGIKLDDGFLKPAAISYTNEQDKTQIGIEIHSEKNRAVHRFFEHLDYEIVKLDQVYFAGLTKKGLTRGKWRFLSTKEVNMLKMGAYN